MTAPTGSGFFSLRPGPSDLLFTVSFNDLRGYRMSSLRDEDFIPPQSGGMENALNHEWSVTVSLRENRNFERTSRALCWPGS